MAMDINSLALPPQTEEQKKQQREKITKLMLNPIQEAEKTLLGASSCQHLFKYVSPIEKELELQREEREKQEQLLRQSLEYQQWQREHHKQMLIDVQVQATRIVEAEKQQVNVDAGTVSHAGTEPKPLNQNSNNLEFSGLLNNLTKKDDWFRVIDDMTRGFHTKFGKIPNLTQAWVALWENPPEGYEITTGKHLDEDCLFMSSEKPLSKKNFTERWRKYTA